MYLLLKLYVIIVIIIIAVIIIVICNYNYKYQTFFSQSIYNKKYVCIYALVIDIPSRNAHVYCSHTQDVHVHDAP